MSEVALRANTQGTWAAALPPWPPARAQGRVMGYTKGSAWILTWSPAPPWVVVDRRIGRDDHKHSTLFGHVTVSDE